MRAPPPRRLSGANERKTAPFLSLFSLCFVGCGFSRGFVSSEPVLSCLGNSPLFPCGKMYSDVCVFWYITAGTRSSSGRRLRSAAISPVALCPSTSRPTMTSLRLPQAASCETRRSRRPPSSSLVGLGLDLDRGRPPLSTSVAAASDSAMRSSVHE